MHPTLVNELTHFAHEKDIFITIETEGSHFLATDYPIDLLSISPKFSNSVPVVGVETPQGSITDERMINQHNKFRLKVDTIADSILYHRDFHIKPVLDKNLSMVGEVEEFLEQLTDKLIEKGFGGNEWLEPLEKEELKEWLPSKIWAMPAGDTREALFESYGPVMNLVRDKGWRFTGRAHIMAFDTQRCV
jgi:7-carboxy-7-deazaguanine synthase